ncbi:hypothetical protein [Phyllobacterium chamaecytisi]|nr:hypothetical protein [Phyllobacterium sp. KW56]MBZ9601419.1 hypothetical protein [Phyllobacterium sp. KW56]
MRLPPRTRRRVSSFIAALGEELAALNGAMACPLPKTEKGYGKAPDTYGAGRTGSTSDEDRG